MQDQGHHSSDKENAMIINMETKQILNNKMKRFVTKEEDQLNSSKFKEIIYD